jgi:uncharacterized protein (DUF697 family)
MRKPKEIWERVWRQFASPGVGEAELERCFQQVWRDLPVPVYWLLGKAQSGKTSLIRALTGNTRAEIGNGFRACTRTASEYPVPSDEDCLLRFLDTRGLGEVNYDPAEDIAHFQDQAHLLIVVMKALDHAQQSVMQALSQIHAARPNWPILVVQTSLHEGYVARTDQHCVPYPYNQTPLPPSVPEDLARSLTTQRQMFAEMKIKARFVAVDFTLPEDGYEPSDYGLDPLWDAIEELLPLGLRSMLQQHEQLRKNLRDAHLRAAHPHVLSYAAAAGAAATFPIPFVDVPLVILVQGKMFHTIASIYHQELTAEKAGEVVGALGIGYLGRLGGRELLKFIPGYGSAMSAAYAAASTYALGLTLCAYFSRLRDGALPDQSEFQKIYETNFHEGREKLKAYLERLRHQPQATP